MTQRCEYVNNTLFTENGTPLPVDDSEDLLYFNDKSKLLYEEAMGPHLLRKKYRSFMGCMYITTHRLIYRPKNPSKYFDSFYVPLNKVLSSDSGNSVDFVVDMNYIGTIYVSFDDSEKAAFFKTLSIALEITEFGMDPIIVDKSDTNDVPYYSEVCDL